MTTRLLAVGDIHLGRRPRRLPEALASAISPHELSPAAGWRRAVDYALARRVDALLLAGDVVDRDDDFFESYGLLEQGIRRLAEAGIPTVAVAGNHDVQVLPRLSRTIPAFTLLGADGTWEACRIGGGGDAGASAAAGVRVVGWSFPAARVTRSPLLTPGAQRVLGPDPAGGPTLGLLHCDRDRARSEHAPVTSRDLARAAVDGWLLGHIHAPDPLDGPRPIGYLGSLVGLDPTETGPHGPWVVEVGPGGAIGARQIPLAPLRWERVSVVCDAGGGPSSAHVPIGQWLEVALLGALRDAAARIGREHRPRALGCRVSVVGRTARRAELEGHLAGASPRELWVEHEGIWCFIDRVEVCTEPALPIEVLARGSDPVGLLAAKLLVLERPADDPERCRLIEAARARVDAVHRAAPYRSLPDAAAPPAEEDLVALLREGARRGIEALLAQARPGSPGS